MKVTNYYFAMAHNQVIRSYNESRKLRVGCSICTQDAQMMKGEEIFEGFKSPVDLCENCYDNIKDELNNILNEEY